MTGTRGKENGVNGYKPKVWGPGGGSAYSAGKKSITASASVGTAPTPAPTGVGVSRSGGAAKRGTGLKKFINEH